MDLLKKRDLLFINKMGPYILYIRHTTIIIILRKHRHKHGLWTVIIYLPTNNFFSKTHFFVCLNISLLVVSSPTRWFFFFFKTLPLRTHTPVKQYCWFCFIVGSGTAHLGKNPVRSIDRPDDYENNEDGDGVFNDGRSRGLSPTGF